MMDMFRFQCGDRVRDIETGAKGKICIRSEHMNGNIRYAVRPLELKDGKPADPFWIDEAALKVVKRNREERPEKSFAFNLGDEVRDLYSDFVGIIRIRCDHQYGCTRYDVMPSVALTSEGKMREGLSLDESSIEVIKAAPKRTVKARPGAEGVAGPISPREAIG